VSFSTQQVADMFRVSRTTVTALTEAGELVPTTTDPRRYSEDTVRAFIAANTVR